MAGKSIFRGSMDEQPRAVTKPVATALLPGTFVEETATQLVVLATAVAKRPLLLAPMDFIDQDMLKAYGAGDTGVAFELVPVARFQARVVAGTYTYNQPLTIGAGGRLTAAIATSVVVAWFADTPGAYVADAFADFIVANSYTAA
jgi:hypothetical protein